MSSAHLRLPSWSHSISQVGQSLHPAVAILRVMLDELRKVALNKEKLSFLLDRCKRVIGAVNQELDRLSPPDVQKSIKQLLRSTSCLYASIVSSLTCSETLDRHFQFIEQMMRNVARLGFMKSLLRRDDIANQITESHQRLTDCLALFQVKFRLDTNSKSLIEFIISQVTAAVDLREYAEGLDRARVADQEALEAQLAILERNDFEVMRKFDVLNNQLEAMMAIQKVR